MSNAFLELTFFLATNAKIARKQVNEIAMYEESDISKANTKIKIDTRTIKNNFGAAKSLIFIQVHLVLFQS